MGRQNIDVAEMTFACVTIHPNWTALAPESALIQHYAELHLSEWNGIGFGPHDPGRNRDATDADQEGFDMQFPIRHEWPCEFVEAREWNIRELLIRMKEELPFLLRYECINKKYRAGHADYNDRTAVVPQGVWEPANCSDWQPSKYLGGSPLGFQVT
jgi:hypothetical protein